MRILISFELHVQTLDLTAAAPAPPPPPTHAPAPATCLPHPGYVCNRHCYSCSPSSSCLPALSWPAFCLHAKLHCPLNWSLLMKIATVFPQFAEYPLPHRLLALHSIPLPLSQSKYWQWRGKHHWLIVWQIRFAWNFFTITTIIIIISAAIPLCFAYTFRESEKNVK